MTTIERHGREIGTVFELAGTDENALTAAVGWCFAESPAFLRAVAKRIGSVEPGPNTKIQLQRRKDRNGITDIEVHEYGRLAWIIEAKIGLDLPSPEQLQRYASALLLQSEKVERKLIALAKPDRRELMLRVLAPAADHLGVPLNVISWGDLVSCAREVERSETHANRRLLRQLVDFTRKVLKMRSGTSNRVRVLPLSNGTFAGGAITFKDVVYRYSRYFHPIGGSWAREPADYLGFRFDGKLKSIHYVEKVEIVDDYTAHFPGIADGKIDPHFLYHLGPPILPDREVRTGPGLPQTTPAEVDWDLLLTSETITEARDLTRKRDSGIEK